MPDFSHLKKFDVSGTQTTSYVFPQLDGKVTLIVSPATEANKAFFNALLRRSRKNAKSIQAGAITANTIAENRDEDRDLYSQFIVKGWKNVVESNGNEVPFNQANCLEFLTSLPNNIFDGFREFCSNTINFLDQDAPDTEGTAKN